MKGDYKWYIAEYAKDNLKKLVSDEVSKSYNEAIELVKKLAGINPIALIHRLVIPFSIMIPTTITKKPQTL